MFQILLASFFFIIAHAKPQDFLEKESRIVNGHDTNIEDVPYIVGFYHDNRTFCAGAILNETTIITASSCYQTYDLYIHAGITRKTKPEVLHRVKYTVSHQYANPGKGINDVMIAYLEEPLVFGPTIQKVGLVDENEYFPDGTVVTMSGWGAKNYWGPMVPILQSAKVPIVNYEECKKLYMDDLNVYVSSVSICVGGVDYEEAAGCSGDNGGPVVHDGKIIGIVSKGYRCGLYPTILTNIAEPFIRDFIKEETGF